MTASAVGRAGFARFGMSAGEPTPMVKGIYRVIDATAPSEPPAAVRCDVWAVTPADFLPEQLLNTAILACFGGFAWCLSLVGSSRRRFGSAVTVPLVVAGYFAAGFVTWVVFPAADGVVIFLNSVVGGMAGVPSGLLISGFIWKYYRREIEGDEDT